MTTPTYWPASAVEMVPASALKAAAQNSRIHSDEQIDQIASSIQTFGWTIPVLIDEAGVLIAGHARVRAALKLKIKEIPAMRAVGWSDSQKEAYQITDNRLAETSAWDNAILNTQIKRLMAEQFDVKVLGFDLSGFDLGDVFNPELMPSLDTSKVTGDAVVKAKKTLDTKYDQNNQSENLVEVVCPHCAKMFKVSL